MRQDPRSPDIPTRGCRRWVLLLLCTLAVCTSFPACTSPEALTIHSVVIRSDSGPLSPTAVGVEKYYRTIFATMRDALRGGTRDSLAELRYLLQIHKKEGMVSFAIEQMERFELLADGLEFELELGDLCDISLNTAKPTALSKLDFTFRMRGPGNEKVVLGGSDEDGVAFQVLLKMRDFDATGQFLETSQNLTLKVDDEHRLVDGKTLEIPFIVPGARAQTTIREILVTVAMLPGNVVVDGRRLPISQIAHERLSRREVERLPVAERLARGPSGYPHCDTYTSLFYPEGHESIAKKPLTTLLEAIRRGDAKLFRHVFLAAHFMPEKDHEKAMSRLIRWVRSGTAEQARVAMGSLRVLSRVDRPVTDRDAWLLWWKSRKPK